MAYRDLITFDRLQQANTGKVVPDLSAIQDEAESVIEGVSEYIRSRLQRVLIVEVVTQRVAPYQWREDETQRGSQVWTYADEQPIVQVEDDTAEKQTSRRVTAPRAQAGSIDYYAGFRRPDQVLSSPQSGETLLPTVSADPHMDPLSTLPPTLPAVITEVAIDLTLHLLDRRGDELGRRTTRQIGGQEVVVEGADPGFIQQEMSRLSAYDRSQVPGAANDRDEMVQGGFESVP